MFFVFYIIFSLKSDFRWIKSNA